MERIVLGFDGTRASASALEWVAERASRETAAVGVVNVVSPFARDRAETLDELGEAEAFLRERAPGTSIALHRLEGDVVSALGDFAQASDLLVVGINLGHPIRATAAGATPLRLSAQSRVPVTMIPAGWVSRADAVTVGVAPDESSAAALAFAAREARITDVPLRLVHAWLMPTPSFSGSTVLVRTPESVVAEHREVIDRALSRVMERYATMSVTTELVRDSRSASLLRFAGRSSMLVIGTHHRGVFEGSLLGSVAQEVLWHAECPVTVVPSEARVSRFEEEV
ncbi:MULTISPECIES: universal stress protein [Microbacterium]|uniref:universal stress protein n=1 Tax=Microbacterium TaxID=33882 RepID=UPI00146B223F|nr:MULTISPECIES: universal stress protein [Microbacterium]